MSLKHLIAHKITRTMPLDPCQLQLRQTELNLNGISEELFRELKTNALKRSGKEYGQLSHAADHPLQAWLNELTEERLGFTSFSAKLLELLKQAVDKIENSFEGFVIVGFEELEASQLLHIFFIQHNHGLYLDADIELSDALYLDANAMRLCCKINISDAFGDDQHKRENALTLQRWRGEKELSEAFEEMLGFSDKLDVSAETEAFLEVVNDYTKTMPEEVASQTKAKVVEYCLQQDSNGKPVVIEDLANELQNQPEVKTPEPYTPPPRFTHFIAEKKPEVKPELIPHKTQLRNFVRISGRNELLSMSFASSCLGDSVVYDPASDSLTIKNIPSSLKNRLQKHFKQD